LLAIYGMKAVIDGEYCNRIADKSAPTWGMHDLLNVKSHQYSKVSLGRLTNYIGNVIS